MVNVANEWADAACNSVVWLKNIRDGISTPEEALKEMEANIARIRASSDLHCTVPPEGWKCSREPGHDGPCAASPVCEDDFVADLTLQLNYMKASHAEEKRRREALEADLAKLNQRLTSANIGLTLAQAAEKMEKLPMAICNAETKRDPELHERVNAPLKLDAEFNAWYNKRYKNPDLTDTWKHAEYQDAKEVWMACASLMFAEYTQRAEKMDDHVRGLEQILREKDIQLSGERGQVEIWKQRAEEWCDKYHTLESESRVNLKTLTKEEATALVTEYGIAILQRSRFQIPRTMKKLLNYLVGKPDIVGIARECLEDVITHHSDFLKACETMVAGESGEDGVGYWQHQVNVLKRMEAQAKAVLKETTWHAGSNSRRMG